MDSISNPCFIAEQMSGFGHVPNPFCSTDVLQCAKEKNRGDSICAHMCPATGLS